MFVQYSLENELQRQQLEERAARVQASLLGTLGRPEEAIARRRVRVSAIQRLDTELAGMAGGAAGPGREQLHQPRAGRQVLQFGMWRIQRL